MTDSDLDALIGEVRMEAARRRAAPDFPLGREAELSKELDRLGPFGGADLAAVLDRLDRLAEAKGVATAELAGLTAAAVRALSMRLRHLERRAGQMRRQAGRHPGQGEDLLARWGDDVAEAARGSGEGRVLIAGPAAQQWVRLLDAAGVDAYGVDPTLPAYGDGGTVRAGALGEHLRSLGEAALSLAVVVGPLPLEEALSLPEIAAALGRAAASVAVVSEAPWSWRLRTGPPGEDTSPARPLVAETWLAELSAAGFEATAAYSPGGDSYWVTGRRARR